MLLDIAFSHISQILTLSFSFLFLLSCMIYSIFPSWYTLMVLEMDFFSLMEKFFKKSICIDSSPLMVSLFSIVCIILEVPSVLKFIPKYKLLTWFKALHELTLPQPSVSSPAFSYTSSLHTNLHYSPTPVLVLFPLFRMPSAFHGSLFL